MSKRLNLKDQKFGRLTVISSSDNINGRTVWLCRCDCGIEKIIKTENLRNGSTKSCGCLNNDKRSSRAKQMYSARMKYDSPKIASAAKIWKDRYNDGDISFEQFLELSQKNCYYCGSPPFGKTNAAKGDSKASKYALKEGYYIYNGLDRIDPDGYHTTNNVVACCKFCNYAKHNRSLDEFKDWIKNVYNTLIQKKVN
jgi:hypothetical protein